MAKVYKKISYSNADSRPYSQLSETDKNRAITILENFRTYFIAKHLS